MKARTVLVIEDDPLNRKLVHALLTLGGYTVLEAASAEEGLSAAQEHLPGCIVMDIRLPGMDGLAATRLLKRDPAMRAIPVIALTAFAMSGDETSAIEAGCDAYITKPIESGQFLGAVQSLLNRVPSADAGNGRVLIVDDEPAVTTVLSAQLRNAGWEPRQASSADEALRMVSADPPDVILMDVLMPGMSGYEATRRLKHDPRTASIPVILLTGLSGIEDKLNGLDAGADEFLSKPVSVAELIVRLRTMVRLRRFEEELRLRALPAGAAGGAAGGVPGAALPGVHGGPPAAVAASTMGAASAAEAPMALADAAPATRPARVLVLQRGGKGDPVLADLVRDMGHQCELADPVRLDGPAGRQGAADLIILDEGLFNAEGLQVCKRLRSSESTGRTPLAVIGGRDDAEGRIRFLSVGVEDVLAPPVDPRELQARVARLLRQKAHLDLLQSRYETALLASNRDGLTGLFNHAYFKHLLDLEVKRSLRQRHPTSLLMLDIDGFKALNDSLGHTGGDSILEEVGRRILASVREIDIAARYGGEEFAVVLPYTGIEGATVAAERIRAALDSERFEAGSPGTVVPVTASIGVASCPAHATRAEDLIITADSLLYRAKGEGKNRVCQPPGSKD